jgi:hypothetical protein
MESFMAGRYVMWWGAIALIATSCILDDERCGEGQVEYADRFDGCVCDSGYVPNADGIGCRRCGDHEEAKSGMCVCEEGYARPSASEACAPEPDAGDTDASSGPTTGSSGQDMACTSSADCEGFDADYCMTLAPSPVCLVTGCARGEALCAEGRDCCEITVLPELAATGGLCVPAGTCMAPGMVVNP